MPQASTAICPMHRLSHRGQPQRLIATIELVALPLVLTADSTSDSLTRHLVASQAQATRSEKESHLQSAAGQGVGKCEVETAVHVCPTSCLGGCQARGRQATQEHDCPSWLAAPLPFTYSTHQPSPAAASSYAARICEVARAAGGCGERQDAAAERASWQTCTSRCKFMHCAHAQTMVVQVYSYTAHACRRCGISTHGGTKLQERPCMARPNIKSSLACLDQSS